MTKLSLLFRFLIVCTLVTLFSCSKDDELSTEESFYDDAITDASAELLVGTWAFYSGTYTGQNVQLPVNYLECGRDYFQFKENGKYVDILYQDSACNTLRSEANWLLRQGVVTLSDAQSTEEFVITKLNETLLELKIQVDVDEDGSLDTVYLQAKRYEPKETDKWTTSFKANQDALNSGEIMLEWSGYDGLADFKNYEVYRSTSCSKTNGELIFSSNLKTDTTFSDTTLTEPVDSVCYYLKIYTSNGILGESELVSIYTNQLGIAAINQLAPSVGTNSITLNWEPYKEGFFDYYEISVSNMDPGITGYGEHHFVIGRVDDINTKTFTDNNPPYFSNPVYTVKAYTIFNTTTQYRSIASEVKVNFKRENILDVERVFKYSVDTNNDFIYIYGVDSGSYDYNLMKYDLQSGTPLAIASKQINSSNSSLLRIVQSDNGNEVLAVSGGEILVYDSNDLHYKYSLSTGVNFLIEDVIHFKEDVWMVLSNNKIYSFKRDNQKFTLIDSKNHFTTSQSFDGYRMVAVNEWDILIGHSKEAQSVLLNVNSSGQFISQPQLKPIAFVDNITSTPIYNSTRNELLNTATKRIYSTKTYTQIESYNKPYTATGLSNNANLILGFNIEITSSYQDEAEFTKQAVIFNRSSKTVTLKELNGFPVHLFMSKSGDIYSISSGLRHTNLQDSYGRKSFFIEKIRL